MKFVTCPRCSSRMGPPLQSGRQVCPHCGWSTTPTPSVSPPAIKPSPTSHPGLGRLLQLCWRIIQRGLTYLGLFLQHQWGQFNQTVRDRRPRPQRIVTGLTERLSEIEQAIPTTAVPGKPWLTPEAVFYQLGGDPDDPKSTITSLDGTRTLSFPRFRALRTPEEFRNFGLEIHSGRRQAAKPWLRFLFTTE